MAGQIVKRGERNYVVRVFLGRDASGKRKYLNEMVKGSKKDAQTVLIPIRPTDVIAFAAPRATRDSR